jgi:hypothetical protein
MLIRPTLSISDSILTGHATSHAFPHPFGLSPERFDLFSQAA